MTSTSFSTLPLAPEMLHNLDSLGYHEMTPIQAKSLPLILKNHDILAKAQTGSGKTAAFGLGLLNKLDPQALVIQSLVICPTRELAEQVGNEIRRLARATPNIRVLQLCGGKPMRPQVTSLQNGAHIVVGTPGRLQAHLVKNSLNLDHVHTLVLDEADRMLDMGFFDEIMEIISCLPKQRQTLLFSATYPSTIKEISRGIQHHPIQVTVESPVDAVEIEQIAYQVSEKNKNQSLVELLKSHSANSAIVFCKTKKQCDAIACYLNEKSFRALAIHSDLEQKERDEVLVQFSNHSCAVLVATDVAARGLDIKDLELVINYDLPSTADIYVHRIGRTGRAGKSGLALSLFTHHEQEMIKDIEEYTQKTITLQEIHALSQTTEPTVKPSMCTLCISGGKKNKVRPGDILGALTAEGGIPFEHVGKITIFDFHAYVAVSRSLASRAFNKLQNDKIKGRAFKIRYLHDA